MRSIALAVVAGALFGIGLVVSGMTDPARVIGFLDVRGAWDPTLAFVMGGAIMVHAPFVWLARSRKRPMFSDVFHWPASREIDVPLVAGAALFGVGWGASGYCPGPALVSLGSASSGVLVFFATMVAGMVATRAVRDRRPNTP